MLSAFADKYNPYSAVFANFASENENHTMMKKIYPVLAILATSAFLFFASTSCERGVFPYFTLSKDTLNFSYKADTQHVQVSSNVEWWIYLRPSFLMMSPLDSVGDADLKIYVTANPKTDARDTVMQITTQTISHKIVIHQDPNPGT
jgi:hypothetical protein